MPILESRKDAAELEKDADEVITSPSAAAPRQSNQSVAARAAEARNLQAKGTGPDASVDAHAIAERGTADSGHALPHLDVIQQSFGGHDVTGVSAHTGGQAQEASQALGAQAFASGNSVAFGNSSPDLHTAAHEAAHVVQQRSGVHLKGGVGESGDSYEVHADAVADKVVAGESAEQLLGPVSGQSITSQAIQKRDDPKPKKQVSGAAMRRLGHAHQAIEHTKQVLEFGAGNMASAIKSTKSNAYYRMQVMRNMGYWELTDSVRPIAAANPQALTAAMADVAQGGNCGEHAAVAYDYLRVIAAGEQIQLAQTSGFDHAFVLMGDLTSEGDNDIGVSDPWPTAPTAVVWQDHFAFTPDRSAILSHAAMAADGQNVKAVIAAGLKLNSAGLAAINMEDTQEASNKRAEEDWVWQHESTAQEFQDYEYVEKFEE